MLILGVLQIKAQNQSIKIIPQPVSIAVQKGAFTLTENTRILGQGNAADSIAKSLEIKLAQVTGYSFSKSKGKSSPLISLEILGKENPILGAEGYQLKVESKNVRIQANKPAGLFYGMQTLFQLFPAEIESKQLKSGIAWELPCVTITDYPRMSWRGLMLDVSRHFFTKEEVKQYIDAMVKYKYNLLHLHLTDNEGWRVEIKKYPKLTDVGAWRVKREGNFGTFQPPSPEEPRSYGGYYTQEDIKELIKYAQDRYVNILPEIDVPGHSLAAVVAYPELSCTPEAKNYQVRSGEKIMDWSEGGELPKAIYDNNLCPANEQVYTFLDDVIQEIAELFPFQYIHMGGDETSANYWEKSEAVKKLMQKEGLADMHEVQAYFGKRVKKMVENKGKKFIGWDEILNSDFDKEAVVMCWRKAEMGIKATQLKHQVIMTPFTHTYLDLMQADAITEPPVYKELRLNKTYQFDPVPKGADPNYILGGQANLWTEQVYNIRHAEYMTWPRALAVAESLWTLPELKQWDDFIDRTESHFKRLKAADTKYAVSVYDPIFKVKQENNGKLILTLTTEINGLDIYYSFDNSFPDNYYPKYTEALEVPAESSLIRVITYRNGEVIGRMQNMPVDELRKRAVQ